MADGGITIRGNGDSEVEQMLREFPFLPGYTLLVEKGKRLFLTHGHIYNGDRIPREG